MESQSQILLEVWREACRHIELEEAISLIARLLSRRFPLTHLAIHRLVHEERRTEEVAVASLAPVSPSFPMSTEIPRAVWTRLLKWARRGESSPLNLQSELKSLARADANGALAQQLVGPLIRDDQPTGLLFLQHSANAPLHGDHLKLVDAILEPFSVALENHLRLHELRSLREAAEADRRSLLSRLGQQSLHETIVGAEAGLKSVMERVTLVAPSDVPILILGETGTGKEVVSRAIHARSPRANGPFIRVNCGAIPPELIDSQLFGHEKGSFTGATERHTGWFERADGGTLFLDEIAELTLPAQVRLLRVLQDHLVERLGSTQPIHANVRVVAATHRDLADMVRNRQFREDLWYRIHVFPIHLPPLRARKEDIPALAKHFVSRAAVRFGVSPVEPSVLDLRLLMDYHWPGNIRELGAVIDRAVILGDGRSLEVAKALGLGEAPKAPALPLDQPTFYEVIPEAVQPRTAQTSNPITLDEAMRRHIENTLAICHGRIEGKRGAAAVLGINPHTLRARMKKLGLDWARFRR